MYPPLVFSRPGVCSLESTVEGGGVYVTLAISANCTVGTFFCLHLKGPAKSLSRESLSRDEVKLTLVSFLVSPPTSI